MIINIHLYGQNINDKIEHRKYKTVFLEHPLSPRKHDHLIYLSISIHVFLTWGRGDKPNFVDPFIFTFFVQSFCIYFWRDLSTTRPHPNSRFLFIFVDSTAILYNATVPKEKKPKVDTILKAEARF